MNSIILCLHVFVICGLMLVALRLGREMMIAWLCIVNVSMNLFVLKQITLFGLSVTASDALAVGYLLGLNLIQEFFGRKTARKCIWTSFFISSGFIILSQIHLLYVPNQFDLMQSHFEALFQPMPRILLASLFSFFMVQFVDLSFFGFLQKKTANKYLPVRTTLSLIVSQSLDTVLFSFIGLYGLVASIEHIIFLSLAAKGIVIVLSIPFVSLSKKVASVQV